MNKLLIFILLFSSQLFAAGTMQLEFSGQEIRQGALVRAKLFVPPESLNLPLRKLKGETLGETLYFHQLSPLLKKEGSLNYEAEVQVIFIKVPGNNNFTTQIGDHVFDLRWNSIEVFPVETPDQLIWADFTAPDFFEGNLFWVWILLLVLIITSASYYAWRKVSARMTEKKRRLKLVSEFRACQNYDDVVNLWKKKRDYIKEFPHLDSYFIPFEEILFRYQFKPSQSENEKNEVLKAYRHLIDQSEGGFNGI